MCVDGDKALGGPSGDRVVSVGIRRGGDGAATDGIIIEEGEGEGETRKEGERGFPR